MRKLFIKSLLIAVALTFTSCINKHGISAKYYSECDEYYDMQGYYHKECGKDDIVTYKEIGEAVSKSVDYITGEEEEKGNVY